ISVDPARDAQLLLAAAEKEIPALTRAGQAAGAEPAVRDRLGALPRPPPVTLHDVVPANRDLADPASSDVVAIRSEQPHLYAANGCADGTGFADAVRVIERRDRARLGQSVPLKD